MLAFLAGGIVKVKELRGPVEDSGAVIACQASTDSVQDFAVVEAGRASFASEDAPVLIAAAPNYFAVVPPRRSVIYRHDGSARRIDSVSVQGFITAVSASSAGLWIGAGSNLYYLPAGSMTARRLRYGGPRDRIVSLTEGKDAIWLVVQRQDSFRLVAIDRSAAVKQEYRERTSLVLARPGRLSNSRLAIGPVMTQSEPPFTMTFYNHELGIVKEIPLPNRTGGENRVLRALETVELGCDRALQTIADVSSSQRIIRILDTKDARVLKETTIAVPIGFSGLMSDNGLLVSAQERPGGRDVVLWKISPQE
jgi:hypothetical protein